MIMKSLGKCTLGHNINIKMWVVCFIAVIVIIIIIKKLCTNEEETNQKK
jgi:hypothetical protein